MHPDERRAREWYAPHSGPLDKRTPIEQLTAEFAAVRAEERAAIVAWLRALPAEERYPSMPLPYDDTLCDAADAIERADHTPAQGEKEGDR